MRHTTQLAGILNGCQIDASAPHSPAVQKALYLARWLQQRASELQSPSERRQQAELERMLQNADDKNTLARLTDQAFRSHDPHRAVEHLVHILDVQGIPRFFSPWDRALLKGFQTFGGYAPGVALPFVKQHMHKETANVILPAEREMLTHHLRERMHEGLRMNVNLLGEAILGEREAEHRIQQYFQLLQWPEIEVVSIKISTLYSQVSALAREHTLERLCDRLERLFLTAASSKFTRPDGTQVVKMVYLDMEEYRDKELTAAAFMRTLDRPGLERASAGIALQAYIPDSSQTLLEILRWARGRASGGGQPITIRLVKGANMEMERVEASLRGWPQATYRNKAETDANFHRMLHECMRSENQAAVHIGIASHNLFDLAYGLVLAHEHNALDIVQLEMLEGMANHQRRALFEVCPNLLLYAPACSKENFTSAVGYLIRRLDENSGPENFLRHAFNLRVDSAAWNLLAAAFANSVANASDVNTSPRRIQQRREMPLPAERAVRQWHLFENEPDTDFSLPDNSRWAAEIVERWHPRCGSAAPLIPLVVNGREILDEQRLRDCHDPSRPGTIVARYCHALSSDIDEALQCAANDLVGWRSRSAEERSSLLGKVAHQVRCARGDLIGAAMADAGKTVAEADPEVSEAVDFLEFYRSNAQWWYSLPSATARPHGAVIVVSPWNFPIAIPCGGIAAALAAGNTVILKPSSDAVLVGWELCQCFWKAGISKRTLQFLPCSGGPEASNLVNDPRAASVILTGGTATAHEMLRKNPRLQLFAETGGKNATIVTSLADRDLAIRHVMHSAFSHSGQKCSATSLLLLEAEVYDDPGFRDALCDAASSLPVGPAWHLETKVGPLIRPPRGELARALKVLEPGEEWALMPQAATDNPALWSPGIKYGVTPGGVTHMTEFFGPLLGVMRFRKLSEAVAIVNQTGYGLTSGLESLDEREWDFWISHLRAGNLYVNRATTGAIVLRQPFGGFGKSVFGPAMKAGGPNYVAQFIEFADTATARNGRLSHPRLLAFLADLREHAEQLGAGAADQLDRLESALISYEESFRSEFAPRHDHCLLVGQDNLRRYLPLRDVCVRIDSDDSVFDVFARVAAAHIAGCRVTVSSPHAPRRAMVDVLDEITHSWAASIEFMEEDDEHLAARMQSHQTDRVRYADPRRVPEVVRQASADSGVCVIAQPVLAEGRVELLWYLHEQSVSIEYHRYGNLGSRATETRSPVL